MNEFRLEIVRKFLKVHNDYCYSDSEIKEGDHPTFDNFAEDILKILDELIE